MFRVIFYTIFPEIIRNYFDSGVLSRARKCRLIDINVVDFREFATDRHQSVDDTPFGGGAGMVLRADICERALKRFPKSGPVIITSASGQLFSQKHAQSFAKEQEIQIICGRYEGIDERVALNFADYELSIGNFVLSGGEVPALAIADATLRLVPGVLGNPESLNEESFNEQLVDYPHFTRPKELNGLTVPNLLLSGNHEEIKSFREALRLAKTIKNRPDLMANRNGLSDSEVKLLRKYPEATKLYDLDPIMEEI